MYISLYTGPSSVYTDKSTIYNSGDHYVVVYLISDQVPYTQHYNFCCFLQTKQHVRDFVYKRHEADFVRVLTILEIFSKKNVYIICLPVGSITNKIKVRKV